MLKRTITSIIALILFAPFIILAGKTGGVSLMLVCQLITIPASLEILKMTGKLKNLFVSIPCVLVAAFIPALTLIIKNEFFSGSAITFFLLAFYLMSVAVFDKKVNIFDYAVLFMMLFYVVISASCIVKLYMEPYGNYVYLLCFFGAWMTDIGAYITGKLFGKHKLIPSVSPKKTVEGAIGGLLFNIGFVFAYVSIIGAIVNLSFRPLFTLIAAFLMSLVSMLGDLIMSLVKRKYGIKDYGDVFPGHGGMLDRFDSVLAIAPFMFIIFTLFKGFSLFG